VYIYKDKIVEKKTSRRRNKTKRSLAESVKMIKTVHTEYDHLLVSPYLLKQDDPGVPTVKCMINQRIFPKTLYDAGSGVNIMAKITYEYLFGKEPLYPHLCATADGRPNISIFRGDSKGCHGVNLRSLRPHLLHGPEHERRRI
jgi:hypothetical protein